MLSRTLTLTFAGLILSIVLPWSPQSLAADATDLVLSVATDQRRYDLGEPVHITVSTCNPTGEMVTTTITGNHQFELQIRNGSNLVVARRGGGGPTAFFDLTWQPGECTTILFTWAQNPGLVEDLSAEGTVDEGVYFVHYEWFPQAFVFEANSPEFVIGPNLIPAMSHTAAVVLIACLVSAGLMAIRVSRSRRG